MFERTLQDLIRGLRAHKTSSKQQEDAFLAEAMVEIKEELKGKDMALKAEGVIKMCYLMMLYPIPAPSGFAFHVVEVMSSPRYHLKQLGYLAAPLAFSSETEEVVLTVNGIKKDLMSPHLALPPLPLTALPHLLSLSPSLSNTLHPDLLHLLTHSSPRIRKRAILCLLECWEAYPEGLREGFPRLREKLQDQDQGVVGATVSVVMELARRQGGKNYLPLAPELFGILTGSHNNWMLIKVVKLFAILTPLEPRLVRKLLPPITSLISSTSAISLLYECVRTCIVGGMLDPDRPESDALARVCVEKLGGYLRDEGGDQNLRYIALLAMVKITPTHPHMVAEYQDEVLQSLDDSDVSIRMRALELVAAMVDRDNLQSIVDQLLSHLSPAETSKLPSAVASLQALSDPSSTPSATSAAISLTPAYRLLLTQKILSVLSHDTYSNITDFEWAIGVLIDVSYISNVDLGGRISEMILDVVGRVKSVREYAVSVLEKILEDEDVRGKAGKEGSVLSAAVWVCGEYSTYLTSPLTTISALLLVQSPRLIPKSLQAILKILGTHLSTISSRYSSDLHSQTKDLITSISNGIQPYLSHSEIEIQERSSELYMFLQFISSDLSSHNPPLPPSDIPGMNDTFTSSDQPNYPKSFFLLQPLFSSHELNAVNQDAQAAVRVPEGLELDKDIIPGGGWMGVDDALEIESEDEKEEDDLGIGGGEGMEELRRVIREQKGKKGKGKGKKTEGEIQSTEDVAEREKRRKERRQKRKDDPYYLDDGEDIDDIPIVRLDESEIPPDDPRDTVGKSKVKGKTKKKSIVPPDFDRNGEMPDGTAPPARPAGPGVNGIKEGLAGIDLSSHTANGQRSRGYEEYTLDEKDAGAQDELKENVEKPVDVPEKHEEVQEVEMPVKNDIEVVKVKRKKKKKVAE